MISTGKTGIHITNPPHAVQALQAERLPVIKVQLPERVASKLCAGMTGADERGEDAGEGD